MKSGYASNTVNRSLSALRSFFRYLLREGVVATDPAHAVRNPKAAKRIPTFVREREMDRLFAYYPFGDDYAGHRDRTLLLLLYHTGLRAAEVLGLDLSGVDLTAGQLRVTGKATSSASFLSGRNCAKPLPTICRCAKPIFVNFSRRSALFLSVRGKRTRLYGTSQHRAHSAFGSHQSAKEIPPTCFAIVSPPPC